ncbi:MAG: FecR domain-containing protein [Spirochaetaceae bacterium]|jgi:hypothetical protein|nr:FecR domain-containing protein [Spirochaetaceae bacterium]
MRKLFIILGAFIFAALSLSAQFGAEIVFAEGDMFTVVSPDGKSQSYEPLMDDVLGMTIALGETILTERGTYIEIILNNSSTIIKIAENTTFRLKSLSADGGGVLEVTYGRIRARVDKFTNDQNFWITGYDTVAAIRGTDFGYDLFYDNNDATSARSTSVYCFDGEVEVIQQRLDPQDVIDSNKRLESKDPLSITNDEMVTAQSNTPGDPLVKIPLNQEIRDYWEEHDFVGQPTALSEIPYQEPEAIPMEEPEEEVEIPLLPQNQEELTINIAAPMDDKQVRYRRAANILLGVGVASISGGVISYIVDTDNNQLLMQFLVGLGGAYMVVGGGLHIGAMTMDSP